MRKSKISILFKALNDFSLISKSLLYDDNVKKMKKMFCQFSLKSFRFLLILINCYRYVSKFCNNNEKCLYKN